MTNVALSKIGQGFFKFLGHRVLKRKEETRRNYNDVDKLLYYCRYLNMLLPSSVLVDRNYRLEKLLYLELLYLELLYSLDAGTYR